MVKARSAGSFLGGIFNNPGVVILGGLAIALLFFSGDIRKAFGSLGQGLGNINITLPELKIPEFKFPGFDPGAILPKVELPEIKLPSIFGNGLEQPQKMVEDTGLLSQEETLACECGSTITQDAFGNVNNVCKQCQAVGMNPALALEPSDAELFASQATIPDISDERKMQLELEAFISNLTPAQEFVSNLPGGFQAFVTPGSSFVGAQINPTPIQNLSLSQIIDMFDVTASQAANILAIAQNDFGDFDFGANTGGGIGSVFLDIPALSGLGGSNVSSSQFEGLSAQEIANILTGGNIQNF